MRLPCLSCVLLFAVVVAGCTDEPVTQPQQMLEAPAERTVQDAVARDAAGKGAADQAAGLQVEPAAGAEPSDEALQEIEPVQSDPQPATPRTEPEQTEAQEAKAEEEEAEPEEPLRDFTDVPATIMEDADVRVRPGLVWRVIERLESGTPVVVVHEAGGFYRIGFGDGREGWIRGGMADMGAIEGRQVLHEPAQPIIAGWQDTEYGVMGRSADGAELRLLRLDEKHPETVGAPIDEITLLADDITLDDLPVLIGDETVVFPGDDFRAGQGRILPRAREWLWLRWGWLLAHNDEYIWQWRPETDELEFINRPPGVAWLSPDGKRLAIIRCLRAPEPCHPIHEVTFLHLDGTAPTSLRALMTDAYGVERADAAFESFYSWNHVTWLGDGEIALLSFVNRTDAIGLTAVFFDGTGDATLIPFGSPGDVDGRACSVYPPDVVYGHGPPLEYGEVFIGLGGCWSDDQVSVHGFLLFDLNTMSYRLDEATYRHESESSDDVIRNAAGGEALGQDLETHWSSSRGRALIFDFDAEAMWIYEDEQQRLIAVQDRAGEMTSALPKNNLITRDVHWHGDDAVMVLARWSFNRTTGAMLIDATTGMGVPLHRDGISNWACLPVAEWSPNGDLFQTTFSQSTFDGVGASYSGDWHWVDGSARIRNTTWQHNINFSDGSLVSALRGIGGGSYSAPYHVGAWSPDGRWFALGGHGHQAFHHCRMGE